ncbi:hypothetical protein [Caulobacter sp. Root343]|uniref:hypothetical protein n=1 Tax=Caulobacter sp. Root343 TaxID=1736520 RepID=UPI0006F9B8E7|nr:hypothetical protein [Caulobacter sp. Root343]KQV66667.1 hypothetical protein ASC70_12605 [Caulobacter sp. Root343]
MQTLTIARPGAVITAEAALALYDLAATSGAASAYEAAAHALAKALQRQKALSASMSRPAAVAPLGAPCEPAPAKPVRKAAARAIKAADDALTAIFTAPRSKAAAGSFWVVWNDGSATRVSGVVYNATKPQTRWAAALRAADQLRRTRARDAYAVQLAEMAADEVPALRVHTSAGVMVDSPDWQRLTAIRPMAALAAIFDEASEEMFTPPAGGDYGAGDAAEARALEARLVPPRLFWRSAEVRAQGGRIFRGRSPGAMIVYERAGSVKLRLADMDTAALASMRSGAREAFSDSLPPPVLETADLGDVPPASFFELDGAAVVIDSAAAANDGDKRFAACWAGAAAGKLIRWTFKRLPGGREFRLTATDGRCVNVDGQRASLLRLAV